MKNYDIVYIYKFKQRLENYRLVNESLIGLDYKTLASYVENGLKYVLLAVYCAIENRVDVYNTYVQLVYQYVSLIRRATDKLIYSNDECSEEYFELLREGMDIITQFVKDTSGIFR